MTDVSHFTNEELVAHLEVRNDLTALEHELLDRLIRTMQELERAIEEVPACHPTGVATVPGEEALVT